MLAHPSDGTITTIAGNGTPGESGRGGPAHRAQLNWPCDMAMAADGSLYIAEPRNHCIRKIWGLAARRAPRGQRS